MRSATRLALQADPTMRTGSAAAAAQLGAPHPRAPLNSHCASPTQEPSALFKFEVSAGHGRRRRRSTSRHCWRGAALLQQQACARRPAADNRHPWSVALLHVVWCPLHRFLVRVVRCLLRCRNVVRCLLRCCNVVRCMLSAAVLQCCPLHAVRCMLSAAVLSVASCNVVRCNVACSMLRAVGCLLQRCQEPVVRCTPNIRVSLAALSVVRCSVV